MTLKDIDFKKSVVPIFILIFCLLMISFSRGMGESFGVFLLPLSDSFNWDRASVASIYSVYMVCLGFGSLLSGGLSDPEITFITCAEPLVAYIPSVTV